MEQEGSVPCSQLPTSGLNPEPDESSPHPHIQMFWLLFCNSTRFVILNHPKIEARFEAFTEVMIILQAEVFRDVTSCSSVVGYQRFEGPCCSILTSSWRK